MGWSGKGSESRIGGFVGEILDQLQAGMLGAPVLAQRRAAGSSQGMVHALRGGGLGSVMQPLRGLCRVNSDLLGSCVDAEHQRPPCLKGAVTA